MFGFGFDFLFRGHTSDVRESPPPTVLQGTLWYQEPNPVLGMQSVLMGLLSQFLFKSVDIVQPADGSKEEG